MNLTASALYLFADNSPAAYQFHEIENLNDQTDCIQSYLPKIDALAPRLSNLHIELPAFIYLSETLDAVNAYFNMLERLFKVHRTYDTITVSKFRHSPYALSLEKVVERRLLSLLRTLDIHSLVLNFHLKRIKAFTKFCRVSSAKSLQFLDSSPAIYNTLSLLTSLTRIVIWPDMKSHVFLDMLQRVKSIKSIVLPSRFLFLLSNSTSNIDTIELNESTPSLKILFELKLKLKGLFLTRTRYLYFGYLRLVLVSNRAYMQKLSAVTNWSDYKV